MFDRIQTILRYINRNYSQKLIAEDISTIEISEYLYNWVKGQSKFLGISQEEFMRSEPFWNAVEMSKKEVTAKFKDGTYTVPYQFYKYVTNKFGPSETIHLRNMLKNEGIRKFHDMQIKRVKVKL